MNSSTQLQSENAPTLTLKAGGWVIIGASLLSLGILVWAIASVFTGIRPIGDGSDINTYQFDLENLDVPRQIMAASGNARDFLDVYTSPETIPGSDMLAYNQLQRAPWVVTGDRVVGIEIGGEARAYPVHCLNAHEIIQDTLNGERITVTYAPFADAPVVIMNDPDTGTPDFGISGLLCNSSLVMYDRDAENPSLWSPLLGRAIAGPQVGTEIHALQKVNICTWRDWLEAHPDTTVVLPDPANERRYKAFSYIRYFNDRADGLKYPVAPLPAGSLTGRTLPRLKSRVVVITAGGERRVWPLTLLVKALEANGADEGTIRLSQGGVPLEFTVRKLPQSVLVHAGGGNDISVAPMLFFAWWSMHPNTVNKELVRELPSDTVVIPRQR